LERFSFIFLVAGLFFFVLAFVVSGWFPMIPVQDLETRTLEQLSQQQPLEFLELKEQYPEAYDKAFPGMNDQEAFSAALKFGHKIYVAEACWHCHSQQIRPWGNDEARYGPKSFPEEYQNVLNMPPLWGTRRIGPDLIRLGGRQSNDWHVAHFYHPRDVAPFSVMPDYPWFYEEDGLTPNAAGLSIISYVQWLGSWIPSIDENINTLGTIERIYPAPAIERPLPEGGPADTGAAEEDIWGEEGSEESGDDDFWTE
jgi:cytochrome c oxidase cbb3-type subunit 2